MGEITSERKQCIGVDCPNEAGSLQCPTCLKAGKESSFCSQDCFKRSWVGCLVPRKVHKPMRIPQTLTLRRQTVHKAVHKSTSGSLISRIHTSISEHLTIPTASTLYNPFPNFPFTGPLRPTYPLSPKREIPESIPHPPWSKDGNPKYKTIGRNNIKILDKQQQDGMRKVCRLAREVLDLTAREVKPGITTDYLDSIVHRACIDRNVNIKKRKVLLNR